MDPLIGGAAIGAAGNLLGQVGNMFGARRRNKRMVDFWKMQNEYNHPKAQMQRLQEAGLNPNLIYGDSVSGATGQAGDIGQPDRAEFGNPLSEIATFQNLKAKRAQTDLLQQQVNTEFQRGILMAEQQSLTGQQTSLANQKFNQQSDLFKSQLQASELNVKNMEQEILGRALENDFKNQALRDRVGKLYWEAKNAEQTYKGTQLNNILLKLQTQFLNLGLDRNSPWYAKIFGNIVNKVNQK